MPGRREWGHILSADTSNDVHVTDTIEGMYIFYTEHEEAYIRTDTVIDVRSHR